MIFESIQKARDPYFARSTLHSDAAASTAPAALNMPRDVMSTLTGYFHSIKRAHPVMYKSATVPIPNLAPSIAHASDD